MSNNSFPQWRRQEQSSGDTFWSRHYELATLAEEACDKAIDEACERWLKELEATEGPAASEEN